MNRQGRLGKRPMSRSRNKRPQKPKAIKFMDVYGQVRKAPVPATKVHNPKRDYDRRDKSWMENDED